MRYREIEKKLRKLGCIEVKRRGKGSHRKWYNPNSQPVVIVAVPDWGSKDLKTGTLRGIVKAPGLSGMILKTSDRQTFPSVALRPLHLQNI